MSEAEYSLTERRFLLELARRAVTAAVYGMPLATPSLEPLEAVEPGAAVHLHQPRGAFVTLTKQQQLRGCIGMVAALSPLDETVAEMARAAALEDPRFSPVSIDELAALAIEISVLSPMFEIDPEAVVVGRHGLMITHNGRRGLLLPQVPVEWNWDRETFLAQTCRKAGLPLDQWQREARLEAFTAEVFSEASVARQPAAQN